MSIKLVPLNESNANGRNWQLTWHCEWPEWFGSGYSWRNFTLCRFEIEHGSYKGKYIEVVVYLLGFGVSLEWWDRLSRSVWSAQVDQDLAGIKESMGLNEDSDDGEEEW